ncbi:platelet glycoprotein VI isoform X3 [Lynx rufus]|uniref:platelet glycoprotein VI isoform X3 n=1 Tax=Lynx rufus TaxID=61384 RepID=UPI001F1251AA|nr:platelet glycoprotein VI isoform X3 [Lynx rufus]
MGWWEKINELLRACEQVTLLRGRLQLDEPQLGKARLLGEGKRGFWILTTSCVSAPTPCSVPPGLQSSGRAEGPWPRPCLPFSVSTLSALSKETVSVIIPFRFPRPQPLATTHLLSLGRFTYSARFRAVSGAGGAKSAGSLVPLEKPVTIQCQGPPGVDLYRLEKLRSGKYKDQAVLSIPAMKQSFAGCYRCSYQNGTRWSPPSDRLELVATGTSATPGWLPTEPPSSVTEFPEASRKLNISFINKGSTTEPSRNITIFPKGSDSPIGLAQQHYTKGNLVRICLGAVILILLVGFLAEDWHSRKKPLLHLVRAVHRPLPPLPQTQKPHSWQDKGRPDGYTHGCHN